MDSVREKMIQFRQKRGYTRKEMAYLCDTSSDIIGMIENGDVTHPKIAERIGEVYGLSKEEIYELMPENRRPGSPEYDPDKYVDWIKMDRKPQFGAKTAVGTRFEQSLGYARERMRSDPLRSTSVKR